MKLVVHPRETVAFEQSVRCPRRVRAGAYRRQPPLDGHDAPGLVAELLADSINAA